MSRHRQLNKERNLTTANTEAVKLNVSGLQGLKKEIESVIGTRDQNIKRAG